MTTDFKVIDMVKEGTLLPPPPGTCEQCATAHDPKIAHNWESIYWQYWFYKQHGRWPKIPDAMAHCTPEAKMTHIKAFKLLAFLEPDSAVAAKARVFLQAMEASL